MGPTPQIQCQEIKVNCPRFFGSKFSIQTVYVYYLIENGQLKRVESNGCDSQCGLPVCNECNKTAVQRFKDEFLPSILLGDQNLVDRLLEEYEQISADLRRQDPSKDQ